MTVLGRWPCLRTTLCPCSNQSLRSMPMSTAHDLHAVVWRKSSHSGSGDEKGGNSCLEVADHIPGLVPVRDSKSAYGPALMIPATAWGTFIATLR
ncbi:DUF397 domain-containing protein [Streptomyces sp. NPDC037389]|uniref:DUF397 domain-containing protein n=1 Tax=Streptomyces sp. NPDC037389 TaxID=3155369 RepID=UPI0033EE53ED